MKIGKARYIYEVEFELELDFYFQTSHIFTISKKQYAEDYPPSPLLANIQIEKYN